MTVKELIEKLSEYPNNYEVKIRDDTGYWLIIKDVAESYIKEDKIVLIC